MNVLTVISPGLKVLFERVGKPEVINRPDFSQFGGTGAVIACNHVGWADSLWMAYAVYPRQLRYMSKQELTCAPTIGVPDQAAKTQQKPDPQASLALSASAQWQILESPKSCMSPQKAR